MIFYIIAGILVTILIAIAIVKYVPLKMHWLVSIVLVGTAVFLGYKIYNGIMAPINFNIEKKVRYAKVIDNLKMIRDAELAHNTITGDYADNIDSLIIFIDTAQFAITQTRNVAKTINLGGGITKEVEEKIVDTIGYESVKEKIFSNRDYKNMMNVPGTDAKFELNASKIEKIAGLQVPVFEARVDKAIILKGLDRSLIKQEKEAIAGDEVKGPYISVGSLEEVSTNGNWPPYYDKGEKRSKD